MPGKRVSVRPWDSQRPVTTGPQPLIPVSLLEVGQQRSLVVGLFMAIQALKLYDYLHASNLSTFVVKYSAIEAVFLWVLPLFNISWLVFTNRATVTFILACAVFNVLLASNALSPTAIAAGVFKLFEREVSISGSKVPAHKVYDPASHLGGMYEVHILPESTALLNPGRQSFCIGHNTVAKIPVRLNSTSWPESLVLIRVDLDSTQAQTSFNYTKRQLRTMKMDVADVEGSLLYLGLPAPAEGLYKLGSVVDSSGMDVKILANEVVVPACPRAYISSAESVSESLDSCVGDQVSPKLVVNGVPPLKVKYSRSVHGRETLFSVQSIQPDSFVSPLIQGPASGLGGLGQSAAEDRSLDWAQASTVTVDMDTTLTEAGLWLYTVAQVEDALGNVVDFDASRSVEDGINYQVNVHSRPKIRFPLCDPEVPVQIAGGRSQQISVAFEGTTTLDGPYTAMFERIPLEDTADLGESSGFERTFDGANSDITVSEPGMYRIRGLRGKFCPGEVLEPSSCLVYVPPEPSLDVQFEEISDKCAGSIGVLADLTMSGSPPFKITYSVQENDQRPEIRTVMINQTRRRLELRPSTAGRFQYQFLSIDDRLYKDRIHQVVAETLIEVHSVASAQFRSQSNHQMRCCSGDSLALDVELSGEGPFKLTYELIYGETKRTQYSDTAIDGPVHTIHTPELKVGGSYKLSLVSIQDANACVSPLSVPDVFIDVKRQRPTAAFRTIDGASTIKALEGRSASLPLHLVGQPPWTVTYKVSGNLEDEQYYEATLHNGNNAALAADKKGVYELISVSDGYCPGEVVASSSHFTLDWYSRPLLELAPSPALIPREDNTVFERRAVCEGEDSSFEVLLTGTPPYQISYDVHGPVSKSGEKIQVATRHANIRMVTTQPGAYVYTIGQMGDSYYNAHDMMGHFKPITVHHTVNGRPRASFASRGKTYRACANADVNGPAVEPISIHLYGEPPFSLTVNVLHESNGKRDTITIPDIVDSSFALKSLYSNLNLGTHIVSLSKVGDSRGCVRDSFADNERVKIVVSDVAHLTPLSSKQHFCVGDRIEFSLSGVAPFEVAYKFQDKLTRATSGAQFSRLASVPGTIELVSVSDSGSSCVSDLSEQQPLHIHDVPSVSIDGSSRVRGIHEGDQAELTFKFKGQPPFSFTYTRSEMVGKPARKKVIETHSVSDVMAHEYSVYTSMQGIYDVISLRDQYCYVASDIN